MDKKYILMGGGGLALEIFEYMHTEGMSVIAYISPYENPALSRFITYLGNEQSAQTNSNVFHILAEGLIEKRIQIIDYLEKHHLPVGSFISKYAYISAMATLGKGIVAVPGAAITGNAVISDYVLINLHSAIAHDAFVGNDVVLGPGVMITGHCRIGSHVTFGANSALLPGTQIGDYSEIGICTFPREKLGDNKIVVNRPGKVMHNFKSMLKNDNS